MGIPGIMMLILDICNLSQQMFTKLVAMQEVGVYGAAVPIIGNRRN